MKLTLSQLNAIVQFNKNNIEKISIIKFGIFNFLKYHNFIKTIDVMIKNEQASYSEVLRQLFENMKAKHPDSEAVILEFFSNLNNVSVRNEILSRESVATIKDELIEVFTELNQLGMKIDNDVNEYEITFDVMALLSAIEHADIEASQLISIDFLFDDVREPEVTA